MENIVTVGGNILGAINFAMQQNYVPIIRNIVINNKTEDVLKNIDIKISFNPEIAKDYEYHIDEILGEQSAVRGTGASIPPMVVLLVSLCLFRVVWIQFLLPFFSGIEGVFILYPVSWGLGALLMILYAWKGKWMEYHT